MKVVDGLSSGPFVDTLAWTLLHFVWQGCVVVVLTQAALCAARVQPASARYMVCCLGMVVMMLLPPATFLMLLQDGSTPSISESAIRTPIRSASPVSGRDVALRVLVVGYAAGVVLLWARLIGGWLRVQRIRAQALQRPLADWRDCVERLARRMGLGACVAVAESAAITAPAVIGWIRPVLLLPASALTGLTPSQLELVIAHELAHIRRHDYLVNLLQCVTETLLFYHPGVWWLSARIREQREYCCDDLAVRACGDRLAYVHALATLETIRVGETALCPSSAGGSLMKRIARLLGTSPAPKRRGNLLSTPTLLFASMFGAAGAAGAAAWPVPNARCGEQACVEAQTDDAALHLAWLACARADSSCASPALVRAAQTLHASSFCRSCHAPAVDPSATPDGGATPSSDDAPDAREGAPTSTEELALLSDMPILGWLLQHSQHDAEVSEDDATPAPEPSHSTLLRALTLRSTRAVQYGRATVRHDPLLAARSLLSGEPTCAVEDEVALLLTPSELVWEIHGNPVELHAANGTIVANHITIRTTGDVMIESLPTLRGTLLTQALVLRALQQPDEERPEESAANEPARVSEPEAASLLMWLGARQQSPRLKPRLEVYPRALWILGMRPGSDGETYEWVTEHEVEAAGEDPPPAEEDWPPQ